jgi:hypothetical protein
LINDVNKYKVLESFALNYTADNEKFLYYISAVAKNIGNKDDSSKFSPENEKWKAVLAKISG